MNALLKAVSQEPVFLRDNWKVILAHPDSRAHNRVIRVHEGVANIYCNAVLVRAPLNVPNGFYLFNERNEIMPQDPYYYKGYPDPLGCWQPFERMTASQKLVPALVGNLIEYCEHARQQKVKLVLDKYGIIPMQRHGYGAAQQERQHFNFGFELPVGGVELILDPFNLKLALVEMMRYDGCHLYHFERQDRETPLVLGYNWDSCALVMPIRA